MSVKKTLLGNLFEHTRLERALLVNLTEHSRAALPLQGSFQGEADLVWVDLEPDENKPVTLDGTFTCQELRAIVKYLESSL